MIEVKNLTKTFGTFKAVDDLSFKVEPGRVFGFLGPNGAGKTTTIRMIVGLSKPTSGDIFIDNKKVIFGGIETNKIIGYLPEQPSLYLWMKGEEYLSFVADVFGLAPEEKKKKIDELLELVDLKDARKRRIGGYSNGMKQRLGIAQALIGDPKALIMDEPVSALDPIGRREVLQIIERLKKDKTIFMSTHILSDVDRICDDVAILKKGSLVKASSITKLKEEYSQPILDIEFYSEPSNQLLEEFRGANWTEKLDQAGNSLKIWLKDKSAVEKNLPLAIIAKHQFGILKYGLVLPDMEDIFMKLLEEKK